MSTAAIIIASAIPAFEEDGPAPLWPWHEDSTLLEYHLEQLQAADVRDIVVVLGYEAERIISLLARDGVEAIIDANWRTGEASSLRVGASAVPRGTDTAAIARIEEPRPAMIHRSLIDLHTHVHASITWPQHEGRTGTPIIVDDSVLTELRNVADGERALDRLIRAPHAKTQSIEWGDPAVVWRVVAPGDLQQL